MKLQLGSFLALGLATQVAFAGDITGTIKLNGTPPAETPLPIPATDPTCGKAIAGAKPTTKFYMVGAGKEFADVVVYLKDQSGKSTGASAAPVILDQIACEYVPVISAAQTGQTIRAKNSDTFMHNVHPVPKNTKGGNKEDNKAQMGKGPDLNFVFPAPEMHLRFKCDVHMWMNSWVSVFDHPYFAVSGKDGKFAIKNVPAGKYTLVFDHRKAGVIEKEVEVKDTGAVVDISMDAK